MDEPEYKVVYRAAVGPELDGAMHVLRREGLEPVVLDRWDPILMQKAYPSLRVRIAVPAAQAEEAERLLADWSEMSEADVRHLSAAFWAQALMALALAGGLGALHYLAVRPRLMDSAGVVVAAAVILLIVISNVSARRSRGR